MELGLELWLAVGAGLTVCVLGLLWNRLLLGREHAQLKKSQQELQQKAQEDAAHLATAQERAARLGEIEQSLARTQAELADQREARGRLEAELAAEKRQAQEKLKLLEDARTSLTQQFQVLANEILEEKSKRFTAQNQEGIGALLDPLKTRLGEFQSKVERYYDAEGKQRSALSEQVRQLFALNQSLSEDAQNLTQALKGESKTRGNWGELVLARILESLGLQEGREYEVQSSHNLAGSRLQPDVVIHLPDNRHIVVDSKVSLVNWEQACSADDEAERSTALRRHRDSLRGHIKDLSGKNYQDLYGIASLDCVVMFVPIEPALLSVVASDESLFQEAWRQNVLLVSASTLFFALRTVAYLWRQDDQNRNAQEIARRGAELYDKFSGFVADMEKLGDRLRLAQASFDDAHSKLSSGRGNVIRQAEMLRELGVKPKKTLPADLREAALEAAAGPVPESLSGEAPPQTGPMATGADECGIVQSAAELGTNDG